MKYNINLNNFFINRIIYINKTYIKKLNKFFFNIRYFLL
jgi:hypothetical protein